MLLSMIFIIPRALRLVILKHQTLLSIEQFVTFITVGHVVVKSSNYASIILCKSIFLGDRVSTKNKGQNSFVSSALYFCNLEN